MPINPNIALGVQPLQVADPMARYSQMAQLQSVQNQNQVSQMQLDQMRRDETTLKQIQTKAMQSGGPSDLNQIAEAYLNSGNPKFVEFGVGLRQKLDEQAQFAKIMGLGSTPTPAKNALAPPMQSGALGSGTFGMAPEPVNQLAPAPAPVNQFGTSPAPVAASTGIDVSVLRRKRDALLTMGTNQSIAAARAMDADIALASKEAPDAMLMQKLGYPLTQAGYQAFRDAQRQDRLLTPEEEKQKIKIAAASRAPAQPAQPQPPVAVVDPVTGKQVYVTREEALAKKMTPANAMEGLAPKEIQAREAKYPVAKQSVTTVSATMNQIDATIKRLLENEKGLNGITGLVYGNTPALTDAARKAAADLKQLKNLAFVQGLTELRNASSTGAAVGNVTNKEGDRFENLKASLETSQSFDDLKASLTRLQSQANATRDTVKQTFEDTYSYRNNTPAASGAVDTSNPLLKGK